jgi:adenosylcobinamide-GDP ribazoletransferase
LIILWTILTGAFHLDGLADTVDGLSGGRGDRQRALAIMRDSRIGAHGAVAVALLLMLKWAVLEQALVLNDRSWFMAPVVARFGCTMLLAFFPYARSQGLGSAFAKNVGIQQIAIGSLGLALTVFYCDVSGRPWAPLAGIAVALAIAFYARSKLGGLTGDVHGASIELSELAVLFLASLPN